MMQIFRHAFTMVQRTIRSYAMLSVTIVLSFSLLLGYLVYTDSALYNRYKDIFSQDRNMLYIVGNEKTAQKRELLLKQTAEMENTYHYLLYNVNVNNIHSGKQYFLEDGRMIQPQGASISCIPNKIWGVYDSKNHLVDITYLDGSKPEYVVLNKGEVLMDELTFHLLGLDKMEEPVYRFSMEANWYFNGSWNVYREPVQMEARVVGTFPYLEDIPQEIVQEQNGNYYLSFTSELIFSVEDFSPTIVPELQWGENLYFYSDTPELVDQAARSLASIKTIEGIGQVPDFGAITVYSAQNDALEKMQTESRTKAVIAMALLLLLGINLYSSFTNALNDRKFEIGVKRAVGATAWDIVRQFLYESILVMIVDIVLSIVLVTDVFLVYKVFYEATPDEWGKFYDWIIFISPYSVAMFAICAITLTVVFSLIFAYQSTQVEIVRYLKAE